MLTYSCRLCDPCVVASVSKTNLGILQKYAPAATGGPCDAVKGSAFTIGSASVPVGTLPISAPNFTNWYYLVTSMDYDISSKDQIRGRYIYNRNTGLDINATLPVFFLTEPVRYHLVALSEYHTFNPNLTNEFRIGFNRYAQIIPAGNFQFPGLDSFPNLVFLNLNLQVGPDSEAPQETIQNLYQVTDNITWNRGKHTFKFGIEGRKFISPQTFTQRLRGDYEYNSVATYFLDQNPDNLAERSNGNPVYYGDQASIYYYAADAWRIRPNLTLDLGAPIRIHDHACRRTHAEAEYRGKCTGFD